MVSTDLIGWTLYIPSDVHGELYMRRLLLDCLVSFYCFSPFVLCSLYPVSSPLVLSLLSPCSLNQQNTYDLL